MALDDLTMQKLSATIKKMCENPNVLKGFEVLLKEEGKKEKLEKKQKEKESESENERFEKRTGMDRRKKRILSPEEKLALESKKNLKKLVALPKIIPNDYLLIVETLCETCLSTHSETIQMTYDVSKRGFVLLRKFSKEGGDLIPHALKVKRTKKVILTCSTCFDVLMAKEKTQLVKMIIQSKLPVIALAPGQVVRRQVLERDFLMINEDGEFEGETNAEPTVLPLQAIEQGKQALKEFANGGFQVEGFNEVELGFSGDDL